MPRGNAAQTKVHYKGAEDDYVIFVDSAKAVAEWKEDKTIPLSSVVSGWKVFVTHNSRNNSHRQGTQGILDAASNGSLEGEFGTHKDDDVVKAILEKGTVQETENAERQ
ncbi:putative SDO1-like protein C21C3.19, partial [Lophium mytilinum]